jgi:hypothetical protein
MCEYMRALKQYPLLVCLFFVCIAAYAQARHLTAAEAKDHIGEHATICGHVASTRYATRSKGQPTFPNLDKPYPDQIFTILIWGDDRPKFGEPETKYRDKDVCVSGTITEYRGTPEIVATDPKQIATSPY